MSSPTPNNEYAVTTHNDPPLPYVSPFPGGIFPGRAILIRGFIPESAKGHKFQIDLCCGLLVQGDHCDDKAFHFNPRFNVGSSLFKSGDNDIVLNSLIGNKWGAEDRYPNILEVGQPFTLRILILQDYFKIALNGKHLCDYMHRLPLSNITTVYIDGSVRIDYIDYQGTSGAFPTPLPNASFDEPTSIFEPILVRKPQVPFIHKITSGGFLPPRVIHLTATPRMNATQFTFNILKASEYLFHLRADFPDTKDPVKLLFIIVVLHYSYIFNNMYPLEDFLEDSDNDDKKPCVQYIRKSFEDIGKMPFKERFRLSQDQVKMLETDLGPILNSYINIRSALSPRDKILLALRFYASNSIYNIISDAQGPSKSAICHAIREVTRAINQVYFKRIVKFPDDYEMIEKQFRSISAMPHVFGLVDGTVVRMKKPKDNASDYYNGRKKCYCLNPMLICGPNLEFFYVNSKYPGSVHDSRIWRNSNICHKLLGGWRPFNKAILLADNGYPTRDYILAPILNPRQQKEKEYNKSHRKVRNLVEHAIGVLKAQFACVGTTMRVKNPILVAEIINAVVILHNLLIYDPEYLNATNNGNIDNNGEDREMEEDGGDIEGGKARLREQLQYF